MSLALGFAPVLLALGSTLPAAPDPVLCFASSRTGGVYREPRIEIARTDLVIRTGDVLAYEILAPRPGARELGVELVARDGRRIGTVSAVDASTGGEMRVSLDAWAGVALERIELVARGELAEALAYEVDDVRVEHAEGPATEVFRDALASGAKHLEDPARGAGVHRLSRSAGFDGAFARLDAADAAEPWHAYDLGRLAFADAAASGVERAPLDAAYDRLVGPAVPMRFPTGASGHVRCDGQRLAFAPVDGGRSYSLWLAVSSADGAEVAARAFVTADAGERRPVDFVVPARGTLPAGAARLEGVGPEGCFLIELAVTSDVPLRALELPRDPRVRLHGATFRWRKEGGGDPSFRRAWLATQARHARDLDADRRALLARVLANADLGSVFLPDVDDAALERAVYEALVRRDPPAADARLAEWLAAGVQRAVALKTTRVAFEEPVRDRARMRVAATDAEAWLRAWSGARPAGIPVLAGDPDLARASASLLALAGIDVVAVGSGPSLGRALGAGGATFDLVAPRARVADPREFGDLPWAAWIANGRANPVEAEILLAVGDDPREEATAREITSVFTAVDVSPRVRRATLEAFATEARRRVKGVVSALPLPALAPIPADADVERAEAAWNARRVAAAARRLETWGSIAFLDGAASCAADADAAWAAVEDEFGSRAARPSSRERADEWLARCDARLAEMLAVLARGAATNGTGTPLVVFQSLAYPRRELVRLDDADARLRLADGTDVPSQRTWDGGRVFALDLPACGHQVVHGLVDPLAPEATLAPAAPRVAVEGDTARNATIAFTLDRAHGTITSLRVGGDDGELLSAPVAFVDAGWTVRSCAFVETGPLRAVARIVATREDGAAALPAAGESVRDGGNAAGSAEPARIEIDVVLAAHATTLEVEVARTGVAATLVPPVVARFPLRRAVARAWVGTPFGEGSAAPGPGGAPARHAVSSWIAGTDGGAGLAILPRACAIVRVEPRILSVEALAPDADGISRTSFALRPFTGGWKSAALGLEAARVAAPVVTLATDAHAGARAARHSFVSLYRRAGDGRLAAGPAIGVDATTLRVSPDGRACTVRLVETTGLAQEVVLASGRPLFGAAHVDAQGATRRELTLDDGRVRFWIGPGRVEDLRLDLRP